MFLIKLYLRLTYGPSYLSLGQDEKKAIRAFVKVRMPLEQAYRALSRILLTASPGSEKFNSLVADGALAFAKEDYERWLEKTDEMAI